MKKDKKRQGQNYRTVKGDGAWSRLGGVFGGRKHEHDWVGTVEKTDGTSVETCIGCGIEAGELSFDRFAAVLGGFIDMPSLLCELELRVRRVK